MDILYDVATGEIICMGSLPDLVPGIGQSVSCYMGDYIPSIGVDKFDGNKFYQ